jgi:hypothetical protein
MDNVSIESIKSRLQELPSEMRKEVSDFIDFLTIKQKKKKKQKSNKEKLLEVSVWDKRDIQIFETLRKDMNKWIVEKL